MDNHEKEVKEHEKYIREIPRSYKKSNHAFERIKYYSKYLEDLDGKKDKNYTVRKEWYKYHPDDEDAMDDKNHEIRKQWFRNHPLKVSDKSISKTKVLEIVELIKNNKLVFKYGLLYTKDVLKELIKHEKTFLVYTNKKLTTKYNLPYLNKDKIIEVSKHNDLFIVKLDNDYIITLHPVKFRINLPDNIFKILNLIKQWKKIVDDADRGKFYNHKYLKDLSKLEIPEKFKEIPSNVQIYRGIRLSKKAYNKLLKKKTIRLRPRLFSSWSFSADIAERFISIHTSDYPSGAVLKYKPKPEDVLINIDGMKQYLFDMRDGEYEVILKNNNSLLTVSYEDVIILSDNHFYDYPYYDTYESDDDGEDPYDNSDYEEDN